MTIDSFMQATRNFVDFYTGGVPAALAVKEYVDNFPKFVEQLSRLQWAVLDTALAELDSRPEFTLAEMGLFAAKANSPEFTIGTNSDAFIIQFKTFLNHANFAQIRLCPAVVVTAFQRICEVLGSKQSSMQGIQLIIRVIRSLQKTPRQITSLHSILFQMCLESLNLKVALPFLVDDADDFVLELRGTDGKPLLLYFYYGGMIFAGLKNYNKALFFLEACLRVPTYTLSFIMLEAYKKYVLLSLYYHGEVLLPAKCAAHTVNRILKPNAIAYNEIATAFLTHNPSELNAVINRQMDTIRRDRNLGLVKQVKIALTKLNIQRLTKTFLTLSLADLASRAQLPGGAIQAEEFLVHMIEDGEIYAKINQKDGMVIFLDNREKYNNVQVMQKIEDKIGICINLNKRLAEMNEKLATNPEYVSKTAVSNEDEGISSSKISSIRGPQFDQL